MYHTRVWGGRRLASMLGRELPDEQPYGESWELCDREEAQSVVAEGALAGMSLHELWSQRRTEVFGGRFMAHPAVRFPMLLKILDCVDTLSLQVHPPAAIAASMDGEPKTEMWFVAHADEGAKLYAGLRNGVTRAAFEAALADGSVANYVHSVVPQRREFMFVESGRLHALGAGLLVYEIQQNSDTTYRVFDWNRVGLDGKPRALHVAESMRCIDFDDFEPAMQMPAADGEMVRCDYFATRSTVLAAGTEHELALPAEFVCLAVTQGAVEVAGTLLRTGDFVLLPAAMAAGQKVVRAAAAAEFLEIRLP